MENFIPSLKISHTGLLPVFAVRWNKCSLLPQHHSALFELAVVSSALFWISPSSCSAVQWLRSCSISGTSPGGFQFVTGHLKSVLPNLYQNSKYGPPLRVEEFLSSFVLSPWEQSTTKAAVLRSDVHCIGVALNDFASSLNPDISLP